MNRSTYRITLDLHDRRPLVSLRMTAGDTARRICISFADGAVPYVLTSDVSARLCAVKPSGAQIFNTMTVSGGAAYYDVTSATLDEPGTVECQVRLYDAENGLISSPRFTIESTELLLDGGTIEGTNEYTALTEALGSVSGAVSDCAAASEQARSAAGAAEGAAQEANGAAAAAVLSKEAADRAVTAAESAGHNATAATADADGAAKAARDAAAEASDSAARADTAAEKAEAAAEGLSGSIGGIYDEISSAKETFMSFAGCAVYRRKMFMPLTGETAVDLKLEPSDLMQGQPKGLVMFTYSAGKEYTGTFTVRTGSAGSQYEYTDIPLGKLAAIGFPAAAAPTFTYRASEDFPLGAVDMTLIYPKDITSALLKTEAAVKELREKTDSLNDMITVPALIGQHGTKQALRTFAQANADGDLTNICSRFFKAAAASVTQTYTSRFHRYEANSSSSGTKLADNEGLVCVPSTAAVHGTDDYAELPLFACFDVNYTVDENTLEPVIHAVKDVYGSFTAQPEDSLVGVMQMTGWVRRTSDGTAKTVEYRAQRTDGFKPLPEAVRASDNSVRPFVIHAKYAAGYNSAGRLSSVSGVQPATHRPGSAGSTPISHDGQIGLWREWGNQYCGSGLCDIAFIQLMLEIKYAVLGSAQVMQGCRSYSTAYTAAAAETGVTRVLLTAAQGAYFVVGSCVSLGSSNARARATEYDVCDITKILSIEDVTVNGTAYKAVNLDTETPFNTTTKTYIIPQPWATGSTDGVQGNDGSPTSNTSGKEPCKIQGIEVMLGMYEAPADTTLYENTEKYTVYLNRKASEIVSNGSGIDSVAVGTIPKEENTAWKYVSELNWDANDQEAYMLAQVLNATSGTGYRGAVYRDAAQATGWREWMAFNLMLNSGYSGFVCAFLHNGLGYADWTVGARACGSGGNRGEYTLAAGVK